MNHLPPCTFNDRVCIWDTIPIFFHQFRLVDRHDSCSFIGGHTPLILKGLQWWVHTRKLFYPGHVGVFPKPMVFWACWIPDRVAAGQLLVKFFSIPVIVHVPSGKHTKSDWTWTIEIVDLPIQNGGSFHSYVNVYQRVEHWSKTLSSPVIPPITQPVVVSGRWISRKNRPQIPTSRHQEPPQKYSLGFPRKDRVFPCPLDDTAGVWRGVWRDFGGFCPPQMRLFLMKNRKVQPKHILRIWRFWNILYSQVLSYEFDIAPQEQGTWNDRIPCVWGGNDCFYCD